jgi:hypothetical protein
MSKSTVLKHAEMISEDKATLLNGFRYKSQTEVRLLKT